MTTTPLVVPAHAVIVVTGDATADTAVRSDAISCSATIGSIAL